MRNAQASPIGEVIKGVVEKLSRKKTEDLAQLFAGWSGIAGKKLFRHTKPLSLKRGTLLLGVDESAWLYQAALEREQLLKAIERKIGAGKIQRIQFRISKI